MDKKYNFEKLNESLSENYELRKEQLDHLNSILGEVKIIEKELSPDEKMAVLAFQRRKAKMSKTEGFNKIGGYKNIKDYIIENFIAKGIVQEKAGKKVTSKEIPNVMLFYGPTGNGKSTFCKAVAEETQAFTAFANDPGREIKVVDQISLVKFLKKTGKESEERYNNSGLFKTRTMIIVDEADAFIDPDEEGYDELVKFMSNCSDTHKCSVFLTSNTPDLLGEAVLNISKNIPLAPPKTEEMHEVFENVFESWGATPFDFKNVVRELNTGFDKKCSNSNLAYLCQAVFAEKPNSKEEDFLSFITRLKNNEITTAGETKPNLSAISIKEFEDMKRILDPKGEF